MSLERPVRTLNPEVARKIAAGEVIDRPNAIVHELMDNAIDAGATSITVEISGGGIEKIRIIDNGGGMTRSDLENCARPHATSKISTETDLLNLSTLGFRGEALASIAAVSRLSIQSGGYKMRASITEDHIIEPAAELEGTIVQAEGLFENFPARRQFLKRPATEGIMCRNTFIEKALARPDIEFRFISDGETKLNLPKNQTIKDRFIQANSYNEAPELFFEIKGSSDDNNTSPEWSFTVVIGEPAVYRTNKKEIVIYANGRRIQEYSLVQAVEYGAQGYFPNGTYPVAAVFANVRPDLIDFNIHPAKREARFSDISGLHHGLSSTIKTFFHQYTYSNFTEDKAADDIREVEFDFTTTAAPPLSPKSDSVYEKHISYKTSETKAEALSDFRSKYLGIKRGGSTERSGLSGGSVFSSFSTKSLAEEALRASSQETKSPTSTPASSEVRFIGSCLGTFLLAEKNDTLYIVDQHAAHERILFDKLMNSQGDASRQQLLIPYKIRTESKTQDNQLEKLKDELCRIGFETEHTEDGLWEIKTIPERWTGTEYDLRTLIFVKQVEPKEIIRSIAAMTACKAAVKDGYVLDDITAARLVEQAFTLEDPHCPHGRPIYTVISRAKLFELVKRT